jgi:2-hydroxy-3-keto-5-methylthiopentenyl-1-phosphate phosphatase
MATDELHPAILAFAKGINDLIDEVSPGATYTDIYGMTNYMDIRFAKVLEHIQENSFQMKPQTAIALGESMVAFLDHIKENGGTYFLPTSGTYKLHLEETLMRDIARQMVNCIEIMHEIYEEEMAAQRLADVTRS